MPNHGLVCVFLRKNQLNPLSGLLGEEHSNALSKWRSFCKIRNEMLHLRGNSSLKERRKYTSREYEVDYYASDFRPFYQERCRLRENQATLHVTSSTCCSSRAIQYPSCWFEERQQRSFPSMKDVLQPAFMLCRISGLLGQALCQVHSPLLPTQDEDCFLKTSNLDSNSFTNQLSRYSSTLSARVPSSFRWMMKTYSL